MGSFRDQASDILSENAIVSVERASESGTNATNTTCRKDFTGWSELLLEFHRLSTMTEGPAVQFDVCRTGIRAGAAPGGPDLPPRTWVMRGGCLSLCGIALRPLELLVGAALRLKR